ncbi:MAG: hypothetical protein NOU37_03340 [Candidatus Brocadiales bacterium]|nr:hypothetical protein [Candidatus Bathyanammoxibius amoris]
MNLDRRAKIMLIALILLLPLGVYRFISTFRGGGSTGTTVISPPDRSFVPRTVVDKGDVKGLMPDEAEGEARKFQPVSQDTVGFKRLVAAGSWGRNPFLTPEEIRKPSVKATRASERTMERAPPSLTVTSVLISGEEGVAVINGEFYVVGDTIKGTRIRIVSITTDGVIIETSGIKELIPLAQSGVRVESVEVK